MQALLTSLRKKYFNAVAKFVPKINVQFIMLTHVLEDRPELLSAINDIAPISLLIAVPYSIHQPTLTQLQQKYKVATPELKQLYDKDYLVALITHNIDDKLPTIILEIGGYFAPALQTLQQALPSKLLGVVEDTEAGHRAYERIAQDLPCPVISVARSALKETEDALVGPSCLYSTEKIFRGSGFPIDGKRSLTLGFGKVGRGLAHALQKRYCPVSIYDINPIRRINALSEGFQIPDRKAALKNAEIIYGATGTCSVKGEDFRLIKNGALLVSCSSKDIEFDLPYLTQHYNKQAIFDNLVSYTNEQQVLYLAAQGRPINFVDGAVIGPVLALVQSEIILAIKQLVTLHGESGLFETDKAIKDRLAQVWLKYFCDGTTGHYTLDESTSDTLVPFLPIEETNALAANF